MRTIEYGTPTHVPAFLTKLWKLVTDESCDELISWSPSGSSFIIFDEIRFSKELLPMYFKHNNMASFVRQLNMYGFRKLSCIDQGGMHCYRSEIEFYHQYFLKGQESLLELIKRKIPSSKSEEPKVKQEYIEELKNNIRILKNKADHAEQGMRLLKRDNRMLWKQVSVLTEQYSKQQVILQQLLPLFVNMMSNSNHREIPLKRKAHLMINEGSMQEKLPRLSSYYVEHSDQDTVASMPSSPGNVSNRGPVIHDVTELESKMFPANILCSPNTSSKENEAIVDSPLSCSLESSQQNSPFTDSAVETLNILNQNFERSNSISPRVELKQSSAAASPPLHHHPSQIRAMPSPPTPRYSAANGISPVTIIDETTSDVPLSGNLMTSSFTPKIEDTCTDSGMYTMDGMLNKRSPIMSERSPILPEQTSLTEESPSIMTEQTRSMMQDHPTSIITEQSRPIMRDQPASIINEPPRPMLRDQSVQLLSERTVNGILSEQRASMLSEQASALPNRITPIKSNSPLNGNAPSSTSSPNKFFPNSFDMSTKSFAGNGPWLLNQESVGNIALENWLGDVFIGDNLTPGLSLPQRNPIYVKNE